MKISVFVKPNSRQAKIQKTENGYIAYVKEAPVENKANLAVIKLLSEYFNTPKSQIRIISGLKSKRKLLNLLNK
jgi:uncharacterized protein YggU (UPF0235/DUF167 family)